MCGIAGAIGAIHPQIVAAVRRMNIYQTHRGPDGEGFWPDQASVSDWTEHRVILAHRRLAIIDLSSAGRQPMVDSESGDVLVFNGEIYNFLELRVDLEALGVRFRTHTDTEVLLLAYRQWGEDFVSRLRGIFAFVLWNPPTRRVLMVRDHLGVKPLYWSMVRHNGEATVLFSSELRALLATGLITRTLDPVGLASYLWHGFVVGPGTIVRDVRLLPAGTVASIDVDVPEVVTQPYWRIPSPKTATRDVEPLRHTLLEAVRMQLVSDVPLGVFLSGGIDSSATAALAVRSAGAAQIRTFTVGFDEARYDETPHAAAVASALGTDHHEIRLSQQTFRDGLGGALGSLDQPTFDAINSYFVSRAVREAGITVALAGTGGDELFGGYRSFRDIPSAIRWSRAGLLFPKPILRRLASMVMRIKMGRLGTVPPQTRWGKLADVLATRGNLVELYQLSYALFTPDFLLRLASPQHLAETHFGLPVEKYDTFRTMVSGVSTPHAISMLELSSFIGERLLRDTDAASMAVGLEARVPLLDHLVIERVAELASDIRFSPLGEKVLLQRLALDGLDPHLFDRPKSGFELPFDRWCRDGLKGEMQSTFNDEMLCESVGLESSTVNALWNAFQNNMPGLYWSRVWAIYVLLWWCREHDVKLV
jgi:asparagine synthase (glutamine-hydrolysing)